MTIIVQDSDMSNDTIKYFYIMQSEYSDLQKYCLENNINIQFISDSYNISSKIHRPIILTVKVLSFTLKDPLLQLGDERSKTGKK